MTPRQAHRAANIAIVAGIVGIIVLSTVIAFASPGTDDDPGPRLQYGGTPIELHFDAPGANVTKMYVDGTPCIVVSFAPGDVNGGKKYSIDNPTLALSCDWNPR